MPSEIVYRNCTLCEAHCGIAVEVDRQAGRVVTVKGDKQDPFSRGYICPKAYGMKGLQDDPDRLRAPLRRNGDSWEEISWDAAYTLVAERLGALREEHGVEALGSYIGNPNAHCMGSAFFLPALLRSLGSRRRFSASSVDQLPKMVTSALLYGGGLTIPIPDLDRTDYLMVLGANPLASNGSLMTAPDAPRRLRAIRERGGKLVVIDPRRSETAAIADEHHFIQPGSDAFFLFSMVNVLFEEGLVQLGTVEPHVRNVEALRALAKDFTPESTAATTRIDAATTRRLARELAAAPSAVCDGRIGTCTQEYGTLSSWLLDCVTLLTGNLDRPGGAMFPLPATARPPEAPRKTSRLAHGRWRSHLRDLPETFGELPVATMGEEIEGEGGAPPIRAMVTVAGNPVLSTPNGERLTRALEGLDFMVSVDFYLNETTRFADLILPPPPPLERSNYEVAFFQLAIRNVSKFSPAALPRAEGQPDQWEILAELAGRLNGVDATTVDELVFGTVLRGAVGPSSGCPDVSEDEARAKVGHRRGPERILDLMLRAGPYGDRFDESRDGLTLDRLQESPHGLDLGPLEPRIPELLSTEGGIIDLTPELLVNDTARLTANLARKPSGMQLIGRRHIRNNNSWMGNIHALAKGRERCTLLVHPEDASRLGLADGGRARVRSRVGELVAPVTVSDEIMPGVVSLPHGFGHDVDGTRLDVARGHAGVNTNVLTDQAAVDPVSGNAVLCGIPVEVGPAS
jgi:anaerobic selenocysteine-containing dehydrogenase